MNTLQNAFPIVAAALGRRLGVRVEIHGDRARTNGDIIQLPSSRDDRPFYREVAWGFLAHEAAHLRWTDFDLFAKSATSPIRHTLLNIIEDIRVERQLGRIYPGTLRSLERTVSHVLSDGGFRLPGPDAHPAALLEAHCLLGLRSGVLGQSALTPGARTARNDLLKIVGIQGMEALDRCLAEVPDLGSTRDALDLVDRILVLFKNPELSSTQKISPGEGRSEKDISTEEPSVQDEGGDPFNPEGNSSANLDLKSATSSDLMQDLFETAGSLLDRSSEVEAGPTLPAADDLPFSGVEGLALFDKARRESLRLRRSLESLVQSSVERSLRHKSQGLRIAGHRLARTVVGNSKVFPRKVPRVHPDTAVHILLDRSPSMSALVARPQGGSARRIDLAWEATIALALGLEAIPGVNPAITAFPGAEGESTRVYRVLPHGKRLRDVREHLGCDLDGSTPLAEALLFGASELIGTTAGRKVLLCLTDGIPDDLKAAQAMIGTLRKSGIEVHGIGLALDVERVFGPSISIADLGELRESLFSLSRTILVVPH